MLLTERYIDSGVLITLVRYPPEEEKKALLCHDELLKTLTDKGYYPFSLSTYALGKSPKPDASYFTLISQMNIVI